MFTVEETFNKQNESLCMVVQGSPQTDAKDHYAASLAVSWEGVTSLHFCEKGVKTAARNYQQDILTDVVESLNKTMLIS